MAYLPMMCYLQAHAVRGKSSIVRALLTEYANQGLRLIEIERDDLSELPEIQKIIQHRPEKIYCLL